mmetsp:Transcript_1647/g.2608  ORF Transcript_1647/g.2608 Transcript_1647/m.2608 type:complete len:414 (+) Transcript_1647:1-1242(+)
MASVVSTPPSSEHSLVLSDALLKCNGQDISRRGKSKNVMIILPAEFSFLKGAEGSFGYIDNYNTSAPELVLDTEKGEIRFQGRFQEMSTLFMAIDLQPRKNQSLCLDITSRALVFDMGYKIVPFSTSVRSLDADLNGGAEDNVASESRQWLTSFGCSSMSHPEAVRVTGSMMSRTATASSVASSVGAGEASPSDYGSDGDFDDIAASQDINTHSQTGVGGRRSSRSAAVRKQCYAEPDSDTEEDENLIDFVCNPKKQKSGTRKRARTSISPEIINAKKADIVTLECEAGDGSDAQPLSRRLVNKRLSVGKSMDNDVVILSDSDGTADESSSKMTGKPKLRTTTVARNKKKTSSSKTNITGDSEDDLYSDGMTNFGDMKKSKRSSARQRRRVSYAEESSAEERNDLSEDEDWNS